MDLPEPKVEIRGGFKPGDLRTDFPELLKVENRGGFGIGTTVFQKVEALETATFW